MKSSRHFAILVAVVVFIVLLLIEESGAFEEASVGVFPIQLMYDTQNAYVIDSGTGYSLHTVPIQPFAPDRVSSQPLEFDRQGGWLSTAELINRRIYFTVLHWGTEGASGPEFKAGQPIIQYLNLSDNSIHTLYHQRKGTNDTQGYSANGICFIDDSFAVSLCSSLPSADPRQMTPRFLTGWLEFVDQQGHRIEAVRVPYANPALIKPLSRKRLAVGTGVYESDEYGRLLVYDLSDQTELVSEAVFEGYPKDIVEDRTRNRLFICDGNATGTVYQIDLTDDEPDTSEIVFAEPFEAEETFLFPACGAIAYQPPVLYVGDHATGVLHAMDVSNGSVESHCTVPLSARFDRMIVGIERVDTESEKRLFVLNHHNAKRAKSGDKRGHGSGYLSKVSLKPNGFPENCN